MNTENTTRLAASVLSVRNPAVGSDILLAKRVFATVVIMALFGLSPPVAAQDSKPITIDPALAKAEDAVLASIRKWEERHWLKSWTGVVGLPLLDSEYLAISPDSKSLAALGAGYLQIIDLATGRMMSEWHVEPYQAFTLEQGHGLSDKQPYRFDGLKLLERLEAVQVP